MSEIGAFCQLFSERSNLTSAAFCLVISDKNIFGEVLYFSNNAVGAANVATLIVGYLNDYLSANDVIVGDKSNATYTITSIDTNPLKSLLIITKPNPINAEPDDEFGFSETVTNFPNII